MTAPKTRPERYDWRTGDVITSDRGSAVLLVLSRYMIEYVPISGSLDNEYWNLTDSRKLNAGVFDGSFHRTFTRQELNDHALGQMAPGFQPWGHLPKKGEIYLLQDEVDDFEIDLDRPDYGLWNEFCSSVVLGRKGDVVLSMSTYAVEGGLQATRRSRS